MTGQRLGYVRVIFSALWRRSVIARWRFALLVHVNCERTSATCPTRSRPVQLLGTASIPGRQIVARVLTM